MDRRDFLKGAAAAGLAGWVGCGGAATRGADDLGGAWDLHCHLSGVPGKTLEERLSYLIGCADRVGIERLCLLWATQFSKQDPTPEELRRNNDEVIQAVAARPDRVFGFVYLSPNQVDFSLKELDRCVRDGPMVGVKLWVAKRANAPELDPIIRRAGELKAVIYQHTWIKVGGNMPGESTPMDLAELAARHPTIPIVCGHAGGDWERGIRVIRPVKNLALEIAGSDPTTGLVEMAVRELGAGRVVYGSDVGGRSFASQVAKVLGAEVPEEAKRLILRENLRRLMGPILQAKGIRA